MKTAPLWLTAALLSCSAEEREFGTVEDAGGDGAGASGGSAGSTSSGGSGGGDASVTDASGGSGGSSDAGSDTSTDADVPMFVGGPCIVTTDSTSLEAFARGDDQQIHRVVNDGSGWGDWTSLAGLDPTVLDSRSDLDCDANGTIVHLVATGANPLGAYMHATGFGTTYNAFSRLLDTDTFAPGAAVTQVATGNVYQISARSSTVPQVFEIDGTGSASEFMPTLSASFISTPDLKWQSSTNSSTTFLVGYDDTTTLAVHRHVTSISPPTWGTPQDVTAPSGLEYELSPTICVENGGPATFDLHLVAVAGGELWYTSVDSFNNPFPAWESLGVEVTSAPDCVALSDSTVHIVALGATGTVIEIAGTAGDFSVTDLGTF